MKSGGVLLPMSTGEVRLDTATMMNEKELRDAFAAHAEAEGIIRRPRRDPREWKDECEAIRLFQRRAGLGIRSRTSRWYESDLRCIWQPHG